MTPADYERVRHNLGLDRSLPVQYLIWLGNLARGRPGKVAEERQGNSDDRLRRDGSEPAAGRPRRPAPHSAFFGGRLLGRRPPPLVGRSLGQRVGAPERRHPAFWLGLILIVLFSVGAGLFPSSGRSTLGEDSFSDQAAHLVLPVLTIVLTQAGPYVRLARGSIRDTMSADFLRAARARGLKKRTRVIRYLLPNALTPFITWIGQAILLESTLSFLNLGVPMTMPSWGNLLGNGMSSALTGAWWTIFFPGAMIVGTVLAINLVGDGLRDAVDPKSRGGLS